MLLKFPQLLLRHTGMPQRNHRQPMSHFLIYLNKKRAIRIIPDNPKQLPIERLAKNLKPPLLHSPQNHLANQIKLQPHTNKLIHQLQHINPLKSLIQHSPHKLIILERTLQDRVLMH